MRHETSKSIYPLAFNVTIANGTGILDAARACCHLANRFDFPCTSEFSGVQFTTFPDEKPEAIVQHITWQISRQSARTPKAPDPEVWRAKAAEWLRAEVALREKTSGKNQWLIKHLANKIEMGG